MDPDDSENRKIILSMCFASILIAAAWPFIYPGLDYLLAFVGFSESPGLFKAIEEFGPIYGSHSTTAPDIFKGMGEASQRLSGEPAALASLPYMTKAKLLMYVSLPEYAVEVLIFVAVGIISFSSRLLPWQKVRSAFQVVAIVISVLPFTAVFLWCVTFIGIAYIQAWSSSLLDFLFLILLFPAVVIRVLSSSIGTLLLARYFVPSGLMLAGKGSMATKACESIIGL